MIGSEDAGNRASSLRGSRRGVLTILAIFAAGAVFVAGLYIANRWNVPDEYRNATPGTPRRSLRFASIDLAYDRSKQHLVIDRIYGLKPDFIMLQRITRHDAHELAQALEMRHGGRVQMFYTPSDPVAETQPGNAILARWPLYRGRATAKGHPRQFGIFAETVVDGKRFLVGSWDLSVDAEEAQREAELMLESWTRSRRPPLVIGGTDRGVKTPELSQVDRIRLSREWGVTASETSQIAGTQHRLTWADVGGE